MGKIKPKQAKNNPRILIMLICLKSHKKFKGQDTQTLAGLIIEFSPTNASDDGGKLDVQTHTFRQDHIVNTSGSKLLLAEGLEPYQLLVAVDGYVIIVYQRHLDEHGVVAQWCGFMLWRHGG
jgi:hypothetical protein